MKFIEYLFFATLLTPTAAVLVAAAISLAGPESLAPAAQALQSELVPVHQLPREMEEQP